MAQLRLPRGGSPTAAGRASPPGSGSSGSSRRTTTWAAALCRSTTTTPGCSTSGRQPGSHRRVPYRNWPNYVERRCR
ncbi:hypothetical protein NKG94_28310 [Micromonospora sp. M12]